VSYIEILILRRLRGGPAHGYELRKRVEQTTGIVLHNNSLYPALRRFEEAGAVTKTAQPQEGRPPRLVYTLTAVGHDLLHDMLADLPPDQAADPAEFMARLGQFSLISYSERAVVLAARTRAVRDQLAHFETMRHLAEASGERWGAVATRELIRRHRQELAWLSDLANQAAAPEPAAPEPAAPEPEPAAPEPAAPEPAAPEPAAPEPEPTAPEVAAQSDPASEADP
jgi:DNA-binding PadR family transcriptional regulator